MLSNQRKIFPCIWQAALVAVGFWVVQIVISIGVAIPAYILGQFVDYPLFTHVFSSVGTAILLIIASFIALYLVCRLTKGSFKSFFAKPKQLSGTLWLGLLLLVIGNTIIVSEVSNLTQYYFAMPEFLKMIMESMFKEPISAFLTICITAAITEEIVFRGIIIRGFKSHYNTKKVIIVSAIIFALVHLNPFQFLTAFLLGAVFAFIYIRTGSLWLCMAGHFLNNFIAWLRAFQHLPFEIPGYSVIVDTHSFQPLWFDCLGVVLFLAGGAMIILSLKREDDEPPVLETTTNEPPPLPDLQGVAE